LFSSNKCYVSYEGLINLSLAQQMLMEYDIYKKNNNIKDFIFQKTNEQCRQEKEFLYRKLVILKDNIKTEVYFRIILYNLINLMNKI